MGSDCNDGKRAQLDHAQQPGEPYARSPTAARGPIREYLLDSVTRERLVGMVKQIDIALHSQDNARAISLITAFLDELNRIPQERSEEVQREVIGGHGCSQHVSYAISSVKWQVEAQKLLGEVHSLLHGADPQAAVPKILGYLDLEQRVPNPSLIDAVYATLGSQAGHLRKTVEAVRKQALAQMG